MKYTAIFALMLIAPVAVLAAPKNSANVTLTETVTINEVSVPPGDYHVVWQGTGPSVEATIFQGKKVVASAPATLVSAKSDYDGAVETSDGTNNSKVLEAIDWSKRSLRFGQGNASSPRTSAVGANWIKYEGADMFRAFSSTDRSERDMLADVSADNQRLTRSLRSTHEVCERRKDAATASLIENWINEAERSSWFLFETTQPL
jgi:Ferritin-like domain